MSAGAGRLHHAIQALKVQWETAGEGWNDRVRQDFEKDYIDPLEAQVSATIRAMHELDEASVKMHRECGPERDSIF